MLTSQDYSDLHELFRYKMSIMEAWDRVEYENLNNDEYISLLGAIDRAVDLKLGRL